MSVDICAKRPMCTDLAKFLALNTKVMRLNDGSGESEYPEGLAPEVDGFSSKASSAISTCSSRGARDWVRERATKVAVESEGDEYCG